MTDDRRPIDAGGIVIARLGPDPRTGVMAPRGIRLYQLLTAPELALLMRLRLLYLEQAREAQATDLPDPLSTVSVELRDVECAAMIGYGLTKLADLRKAVSFRKTPLAVLIPAIEPIKERFHDMEIIRRWRWSFYLFDPDITPELLEHARALDPYAHDPRRRRESFTEAMARLEPQVLAKSNAKAAREKRQKEIGTGGRNPAKTTGSTNPWRREDESQSSGSSEIRERDSSDFTPPDSVILEQSDIVESTLSGSSEMTPRRPSLLELAGFTPNDKNNKQQLHVKQHVLHAERSNDEKKRKDELPLQNIVRNAFNQIKERHPTYANLGQGLKGREKATDTEVEEFEWFLEISVHEKLSVRGDLTWAAYIGYFRHWRKLGHVRATAIAANVEERYREGNVDKPCAYLMSELARESGLGATPAIRRTG